ncbi:hypothetical protein M9H77_22903 [Catharanthus roseus]|uniref:Uncharacterized protein n=1 Tax=Catharanthus roseus TaxID=4058 RepID=A0ACC0ARR9_CATRO|nr:hypothetical protein M9H77_22903 [Catharanthus roseus]
MMILDWMPGGSGLIVTSDAGLVGRTDPPQEGFRVIGFVTVVSEPGKKRLSSGGSDSVIVALESDGCASGSSRSETSRPDKYPESWKGETIAEKLGDAQSYLTLHLNDNILR